MAKVKYECESCFHKFTGDDYTPSCPNCGSNTLTKTKEEKSLVLIVKRFILDNKLVSAIVILIILLLLFAPWGEETTSNASFTDTKDVIIEWVAKKNELKLLVSDTSGNRLNIKELPNLLSSFKITYENKKVKIDPDGKINLTCLGRGDVIIASEGYTLYRNKISIWPSNRVIISKSELKKIGLEECLEELSVTGGVIEQCELRVAVNYDTLYPKKAKVQISIDDKKTWTTKRHWNKEELNKVQAEVGKIEVWCREDKNSVEFRPENWSESNTVLSEGCLDKPKSPEEKAKQKKEIESSFGEYVKNPTSINKKKKLGKELTGIEVFHVVDINGDAKKYTSQSDFFEGYLNLWNNINDQGSMPKVNASVVFNDKGIASLTVKFIK